MADFSEIILILASLIVPARTAIAPVSVCQPLQAPMNGLLQCSGNGTTLTCRGICSAGYIFTTGESLITRTCRDGGQWSGSLPPCASTDCMKQLLKHVNNTEITASSEWTKVVGYYFGADRARLESDVTREGNVIQSGGWRAASNTLEQYIQVELPGLTRITGMITKGRAVLVLDTANEYVTRYRVLHSVDGKRWQPYSSQTVSDQFFSGNVDNYTPKTNIFSCPFDAKYVRINPLAWHENIALRFDLLGCQPDNNKPTCMNPSTATTTTEAPTNTHRSHASTQPMIVTTIVPKVDLCSPIQPPLNGMINCEFHGNTLVCVSNCMDGYIFDTKTLLVKRSCQQSNGVWKPEQGLPTCIYNSQATPLPPTHNYTYGCLTAKKQCDLVGNGDFHACGGCHFFSSCSEGYISVRACPEALLFDAISGVCDYHSRTCSELGHTIVG